MAERLGDIIRLNDSGETIEVGADVVAVEGGRGADNITGYRVNGLWGRGGNDTIVAREPAQSGQPTKATVTGGSGDDDITVIDPLTDTGIIGGSGTDVITVQSTKPETPGFDIRTESVVGNSASDLNPDTVVLKSGVFTKAPVPREFDVFLGATQDSVEIQAPRSDFNISTEDIGTSLRNGNTTISVHLEVDQGEPLDAVSFTGNGSPENGSGSGFFASSAEDIVSAMYLGYFGRAADPAGAEYWEGEFANSGRPEAEITRSMANGFRASEEAQTLYPFLGSSDSANVNVVETFVGDIFENLFNRTPENDGIRYWSQEILSRLESDSGISDVIVDIMAGAQGQDLDTLSNKIDVANAYTESESQKYFDADEIKTILGQVNHTDSSLTNALENI